MSETSGEFPSPRPKESFLSKFKKIFQPSTSPIQESKTTEIAPSNDISNTDFDKEIKKLGQQPTTPSRPPESTEELILRLQKEEQEKIAILEKAREQEKANTQKLQEILNNHYRQSDPLTDITKK